MAKFSSTAQVNLQINGKQANKVMDDLQKKAQDLQKEISKAAASGDKIRMAQLQKELRETQHIMKMFAVDTVNASKVLQALDKASPKELQKTLKELQKELNKLERGSDAWVAHVDKIKQVKAEIGELREEMDVDKPWYKKVTDYFNDFGGILAGVAASIGGVVLAGKSAVQAFADIEQEQANVRKFTGMTQEEVLELNEEFKKMNTRTSREELNKLAQEAGRLGKTSITDVMGFVKGADIINVALDDLGEGATLTLSKLTNIFGVEEKLGTEKSLLAVGSVINELSQNCTASASYLAEFGKRMAGVGAQAHMTIPELMSIAAVLDSQGQNVEASATAISKLIMDMYAEPAKIAKAAGMDVQKFTDLVKQDANKALLELLDTLNKHGGMDKLATIFVDMGADGARASATIAALAGKIDMLRWEQGEAVKAFEEATSVTKEFDVQNNTVQAGLDKAKQGFLELCVALGEKLQPVMRFCISGSSALMRVMSILVNFIAANIPALWTAGLTWATYTLAVNGNAIAMGVATTATKLWSVVQTRASAVIAIYKIAVAGLTNVIQYFTNGLETNQAMQVRWQTAMKNSQAATGWIGVVAIAVGALISYTLKAKAKMDELKAKQEERKKSLEEMRAIEVQAVEGYNKEITALNALYKSATNEAESKEKRRSAAAKLLELYPDQFKNMKAEDIMLGKAKSQYDALTRSIISNAKAKAAAQKILENEKKILELEFEIKAEERTKAPLVDEVRGYDKQLKSPSQQTAVYGTGGIFNSDTESKRGVQQKKDNAWKEIHKIAKGVKDKKRQIADLKSANADLAGEYAKSDAFKAEITGQQTTRNTPIMEAPEERQEQGAQAQKRNVDAAKQAKKELKNTLDALKASRDKAIAGNQEAYRLGSVDYVTYVQNEQKAEIDFLDQSMQAYEKRNLKEEDEYANLLKKKEEMLSAHASKLAEITKEGIKFQSESEIKQLQFNYDVKRDKSLSDELKLQDDILAVKVRAIEEEMKLYEKGEKEYQNLEKEKTKLVNEHTNSRHKKLAEEAEKFREMIEGERGIIEANMKKATINELYNLGKITGEEKTTMVRMIDDKVKNELPGQRGIGLSKNRDNAIKEAKKKADLLNSASNFLSQGELKERINAVNDTMNRALLQPLVDCQSEWAKLIGTMGQSWIDLMSVFDSTDAKIEDKLNAVGKFASAVISSVGGVATAFNDLTSAQTDAEIKKIEKAYEKKLQMAEGNAVLTKAIEEKKEKEIAKLKAEQSKKTFVLQVAMAVAQTAANAISAYAAGLSIGGPAGLAMAPIAAGMAIAQGAIQIATLQAQQKAAMAGYAEGGFTKKGKKWEPAGIVHAGEWVASKRLVDSPQARPYIDMLEYAQRTNKIASLSMQNVSDSKSQVVRVIYNNAERGSKGGTVVVNGEQNGTEIEKVLSDLANRLKEPFVTINTVTGDYGMKKAQEEYNKMIKNKSRKR